MTEKKNKNFLENLMSVCIDGSKHLAEDLPTWIRPIARLLIFCLLFLFSLAASPIICFLKAFRKSTIDPFFRLRTELETKWYGGEKDQALSELRKVKETLNKNEDKLFFQGVQIPPYGKFNFDEFTKILWLLYHWEFHSGNFEEASEVCDYIIEKWTPKNVKERPPSEYWKEWVLNKAKAIQKKDGVMATQEYLLKFIDVKNEDCCINKYLYELRKESKKVV